MSSSLRDVTMSEAADDWLREHVHDLRNTIGDGRASRSRDALAEGDFNNRNPCHVYWKAQFNASAKGHVKKPSEHEDEFNIWIEAVDSLHNLHKKERLLMR